MEPFKNELICPSVLKKVLERDVVRHIKLKDDKSGFIYERVSAGQGRAGRLSTPLPSWLDSAVDVR